MTRPGTDTSLAAIDAAFRDPLAHLETLLSFGGSPTVVHGEVSALVPAGDAIAVAVARSTFSLHHRPGSVTELARQCGVTTSAISQRRSALLSAVDGLRSDPVFAGHPMCTVFAAHANRLVRLDDLAPWWTALLADAPVDSPWGCAHDVARIMATVAMGRPAIVVYPEQSSELDDESRGRTWLIDRRLVDAENRHPSLREALECFCDDVAPESRVLTEADFAVTATAWGVSQHSIDAFRRMLELRPVWRALHTAEGVLVLSEADSKSAGTTVRAAQRLLGLESTAAVELTATRQGRSAAAIRNDL